MMTDLAAILFFSRDYAHRAHLRTPSYSRHKALEQFYTEMTEAVDRLVEVWQGRFGQLMDLGYYKPETDPDPTEPLVELEKLWRMCHAIRYQAASKEETMLQNQIDEIEAVFASTVYKLKFLA